MFKSGRWKGEKKIKALFGMQFQATQVPQLKAKALMISLVPADVGKPTARLGKAAIIQGNCTWENPVYETVKLTKEQKTGRFKEKIYFLVVSSGSSKKGFLGEAYIDFADFVDATGPLMLSLPLQDSDSGAILHVTVQRMDLNPEQECTGENEQLMDGSNCGSLEMDLEDCDRDGNRNLVSTEDKDSSKTLPWYAGEKNGDNNHPLDDESDDQDLLNLGPYFTTQKVAAESNNPERNGHCRSLTDWSSESASEGSMMEVAKGSHDNYKKDLVQEFSHNNNDRFEYRIKVLERQVEVSEMEMQALRKQIVKETKKGQELSKQICSLTEERDAIRTKYEHLKKSPKFSDDVDASKGSSSEMEDLRAQLEEIKNELQHEQHLNKSFRLRLQKSEDSNSEFILAVRDLNERLNQKNEEVSRLSSALREKQNASSTLDGRKEKSDQNKDMKVPVELFAGQIGADEKSELKEKIKELDSDIEGYRKDNEELRTHLDLLSQDYEILKKENDDIRSNLKKILIEKGNIQRQYSESFTNMKHLKLEVERLEEESKIWELQYSESLETIKELDSQIKNLEKEIEQRAKNFEDDLEVVTRAKIEQMDRAMEAEEALRRTKLDSADAVEILQEEIKRISAEMASTIDESVKKASTTAAEADDLRQKNRTLEELLQKTEVELSSIKEQYEQRIADARKEAETLQEQSVTLKVSLDEKTITEEKFQSDMALLRAQYDKLKHHSLELKSENENLQMELIKLQTSPRKIKEENMSQKQAAAQKSSNYPGRSKRNTFNIEESGKRPEDYKPLKGSNTNRKSNEVGKGTGERQKAEENIMMSQNGHVAVNIRSNETHSQGQAKKSNSKTGNDPHMSELLDEVEALKARNKQMEGELKEMQERYSDISLKFAEVEGERQQLVMTLRNLKNGKKN